MKDVNILFVEDEPWIRAELAQFLERHATGKLYLAEDGEKGLKKYKKYRPDIVVSDIKMPNMNGLDMVKEIRLINPNQSIILTTAHSESTFFLEAIELQVDGYMLKPVDLSLLDRKIKEILSLIDMKDRYNQQKVIINDIAKLQGNMLIVFDDEMNVIFLNDSVLDFLGLEEFESFYCSEHCIDGLFIEAEDSFVPVNTSGEHWIEQIRDLPKDKRIVTIQDKKSLVPKTFLVAISNITKGGNVIVTLSEVTALAKERRLYKKQAYIDELTQVNNRASFNRDIVYYTDESKRSGSDLSIILFDLDYFKAVNDTHGHLVGDEVLVALSKLVKKELRETDILARWGGEEFVILLPGTDINGAKIVADSLKSAISSYEFPKGIALTCSFGLVQMCANDTPRGLIDKADQALYRAKSNGRDRVEIYSQD